MKKLFLISLVAIFLVPLLAYGAEFKTAKDNYYLDSGQVIGDNLYVAGGSVNINGVAQKDLIAAGGTVIVNGSVGEDLTAIAGTLSILGTIKDDARVGGGNIIIGGNIGGELLLAGGQISILSGASIAKGATIFSGNFNDEGAIRNDATVYGGKVYINGEVSGNLMVKAQEVTLGPKALIKGNFDYYTQNKAVISDGAQVLGSSNFHPTQYVQKAGFVAKAFLGFITAWWLIKLLMLIVAALVIFFIFRQGTIDLVKHAALNFWKELLRGFVLFFIIPIAIIIAILTIVGIMPALIAMIIYLLMLVLGTVFGGLIAGGFISKWLFRRESYSLEWYMVILGVFIFQLVKLIPFIGWMVSGAIFLVALGSLYGGLYVKFEPRKK
jgi:cytoskeletal protein CcmA (bactofilin family)